MNTASAFSSSETAALEKEIDKNEPPVSLEDIWNEIHQKVCVGWIRQNNYKRICLQFPDSYLIFSNAISDSLKSLLEIKNVNPLPDTKVFILADTTYGSCCVDEIGAAHAKADSIIHFGYACRSKVVRLPVLYMFPQLPINLCKFLTKLQDVRHECEQKLVCIYVDIGYHHILEHGLNDMAEKNLTELVREILHCKELQLEVFPSPAEDTKIDASGTSDSNPTNEERICIFIGGDNNSFFNLSLTQKALHWYIYDPAVDSLTEKNPLTANYIRRRYYYIEKCKDAQTLGLIVATLTTDGYLDVVSRLQEMAKSRGVRTQIISVGRINPAKLANFLEIDCFVLIGCPFNNMYTEKDYYKPIVSVFEAEMALNPAWHMKYPERYVTDFKDLLPEGSSFLAFNSEDIQAQDVSLVSGRLRNATTDTSGESDINAANLNGHDKTIAIQGKMEVMTTNIGLTFEDRTWKGLEPSLGQTEPAKLQKGLKGIPIKYTDG